MDSCEYRELLNRFESLEASHAKLKEQLNVLVQDHKTTTNNNNNNNNNVDPAINITRDYVSMTSFSGAYFSGSPYRNVLEYIGHAVYVARAGSGEIIYWNRAAEKLFGYKDYEIVGHRVVELLTDEKYHHPSAVGFLERLNTVESWSGQLPFKKRTGQIFMAIMTKAPLYEDGELVGIVTVAHDAAVFNSTSYANTITHQGYATQQPKGFGINLKKTRWRSQPQIAAVPHLASTVSNLASKVLTRKHGDVTCNMCRTPAECEEADGDYCQDAKADRPPRAPTRKLTFSLSIGKSRSDKISSEREEPTSEVTKTSKIAAKVLSKLQIWSAANLEKTMNEKIQGNGSEDTLVSDGTVCKKCYPTQSSSYTSNIDSNNHAEYEYDNSGTYHHQGLEASRTNPEQSPRSSLQLHERPNMKSVDANDASPRQSDCHKFSGSGDCSGSSSSRGDHSSHLTVDCPIRWEDLQLLEEIGNGKVEETST